MDKNRFIEIIKKNSQYEDEIKETLQTFKDQVQFDGKIYKLMKEIGRKMTVLVVEIPMSDKDFGACFLETPYSKYLLLNSNQPRSKMYFSFCHDLFHILKGTPQYINEIREVHFNEDYIDNENEGKANLFAANLMMPDLEFKKMYYQYLADKEDVETIVIKMMHYFNAPYIAVLLRFYELKLYSELESFEKLLEYDIEKINELFDKEWLDKEILMPSLKDEFPLISNMLENEGNRLLEMNLLSQYKYRKLINNLSELYYKIRVKQ